MSREEDEVDRIMRFEKAGHTFHCACRLVWGDGECECKMECGQGRTNIIPGPIADLPGEIENEKRRANQLALNCKWLIEQIDTAHAILCPGQRGTWQDRAKQLVAAAKSF